MTFWLQLKLILWKNFVVRRRQKVRVAVELVWPLFLFLILMWVRTRGLRTNVEECHYTEKAMPSTGLLPFLQSFFCTFNNTCHRTQEESQVRSGDFSPESIAKLVKELQDLLGENATGDARPREEDTRQKFSLTVSNLERLSNSIQAVTKQSSYLNDTIFVRDILDSPESIAGEIVQNNITIDPLIINKLLSLELNSNFLPIHSNLLGDNAKSVFCDNVAMTDLVVNVDEFKLLQNDLCRLTNEEGKVVQNVFMNHLSSFGGKKELENYMKYGQNMSWDEWNNLRKSYKDVENTLHTLQYYSSVLDDSTPSLGSQRINFKNGSSLERAYSLLNNFLCGNSSNTTMEQFFNGGNVNRFDSIQDQFRERTKIKFQYDNSTSPKCNAIFQRMEEVPALSILWRIMKPFLVGKILYTPVTNATTELMKRVNASFYLFSVLKAFGSNMPLGRNEAKEQLLFLPLDDLKQISEFLNTSYGKELIYGVDGNNVDPQSVGQSQQIIQRLYQQASSNQNNSIATNIGQFLECIETDKVEGIHDVDAAEERGMQLLYYNKLWALIEFTDPGQESLNPYITYKIRMNTERLDNTEFIKNIFLRKGARARPAIDLKYITYGFAYLQDLIDHAIISQQTGREDPPGVILQQFPYPCYIDDEFILAISRTFPLFMVLSWVYTCSMIVKSIVYEKEERLKETMRVMGLGNGIHWLGWFIDSLIPMLFTIFLLTLILVYGKVLMNSDPLVIYMFLFCYSLSTIAQAFLISVFFSQANLAAASAGIIFFILYLPYPLLVRWMFRLAWYHKFLLSFSSNVAFGIGTSYMALYEEKGTGIQWDDLGQSPLYNDEFNISIVMVMLLVDALIYLILAWYIEAVFPGQYGIPKPWYFLFTLSYWTGKKITKVSDIPSNGVLQDQANENFEKDPEGLKVGVAIHDLRKVYSNGKVAVNGVSLNFYENQITSFLGHNGAGKTTTISILTGLFPPTSGTALINGHDIRTDMNMIRKNLGMCPQHNVLFNRLTVEEHLWFYGSLRSGGSSKEAIETEVDQMIYDLNLPHKRHSLSSDLSGGMQRKLSIAVAFIGGSRVVILDEPTSGVDPFSRRSIWELLLKYKSNRTVILTTHYMDEADLLGDRIAIIANGSLQCCGSSIFLKNRFGSGYHLTLEVSSSRLKPLPTFKFDQDGDISAVEEETVSKMTTYIEKIVRSVRLVEHIGTEISYILPEREDTSSLVKLCNSLDKDKASLGIASYGISDTSLEEIFLRVAEKDPVFGNTNGVQRGNWWTRLTRPSKSVSKAKGDAPDRSGRNSSVPIIDDLESLKKHPDNKYWRQFFALHTKRFHHSKRNPKAIFSELILPALFVCMSLVVTSIFPKLEERPPLDLSLWVYPSPRFMFYSKETNEDPWIGRYVENMKGLDGIGDKCIVINGTRDSDCLEVLDGGRGLSEPYVTSSYCNCNSGAQTCPANIGEPPPPSLTLASRDTMFDMTGSNISEWILNTWPKYEEHRYGGFSFGSRLKVPSLNIRDVIYSVYALREPGFLNFAKSMYPDRTNSSINNVKVWFNNVGWVSSVAYMNAINNLILRTSLPPEKAAERSSYGIHTVNHPMNFTSKQLNIEMIRQGGVSVLNAISVIFALSFVPASFTLYIITERISHSKHLQLVSGVNKLIFWLQELTWDLAAYTVSATLCVFIFLIFDEKAYVSSSNLPGLIALFILYGWACIPLMYPLSFLFKVPSSSFVALSCGNLFIGIITTITTFVLSAFDDKDLVRIGNILKEVFLLFPHFCLGDGLMKLATNHLATASLMNLDIEYESNVFEWGFLGKNLACMTSFGLILFLITLAIEYNVFSYFKRKAEIITTQRQEEDEDDVGKERNRVLHGDTSRDILVIKELSKVYSRNVIPSVDRVSVGVKRGECFGLLGLNGAGKTTTFKMLTGATKASSGDATVMGHSIRGQLEEVRSLLGYCPQFDALDPLLTPYEHLIFYARIRNIPSHVLQQRVDQLIREMGLGYYSDKLAGQLSGGNKRKLSTAIALIGNPPLIFLDEPTSGMDPKARRFLWSCIQDIVKGGGCVVLTSHSMEECQALCTRLTIMVSGRFRCLGSSQHLKMKYGKGHRVVVRCRVEQLAETKEKIHSVLPSMSLIEEHYNQLRYEFSELRLSRVFHELQRLKNSSLLQDFSISQTTLEEVFLRFAQEQQDEPMERKKKSYAKSCLHCCREILYRSKRCLKGRMSLVRTANLFLWQRSPEAMRKLRKGEYRKLV